MYKRQVQEALSKKGYSLMLLDATITDVEQIMLSRAADGLIVHGGALTKPIHQLLVTRKFPQDVYKRQELSHPLVCFTVLRY